MTIKWKEVTWYSQLLAIILFVGVFALGYWLGQKNTGETVTKEPLEEEKHLVSYSCKDEKALIATYKAQSVEVALSDGRMLKLPQTLSGSGVRYANDEESIIFWTKGNGAFLVEGEVTTFEDCIESPLPI